jgi:hypothetical protein
VLSKLNGKKLNGGRQIQYLRKKYPPLMTIAPPMYFVAAKTRLRRELIKKAEK